MLILLAVATTASAQTSLTLDDALREARTHNAGLAVAAFDTSFADAGVQSAGGRRWPSLSLDGHVHGGTPPEYASGDARLQLVGEMPLYDGGALRAELGRARADRSASLLRYRMAQRDVDLDVRVWFAQAIELEEEIALRLKGMDRLRRYVDLIGARRESGEPVAGDLLKAQVQRDQQAAEIEETRRQHAAVLLQLKDILGREPDDDVVLSPLPAPTPPGPGATDPWETVPDVRAADASQQSATAAVDVARAGRRPHLDLSANVGTEPILGSSFDAPLNTGQGEGAEVILMMSWPLWDRGVYRGELLQAQVAAEQASHEAQATRRAAKLEWYQARADLTHLFEVVRLRQQIVPTAEDAYLQTESQYRGGDATALEVLDAFLEWLQSSLDASRATLDYRNAEARERRWGTP